jgi:hypothetical protein
MEEPTLEEATLEEATLEETLQDEVRAAAQACSRLLDLTRDVAPELATRIRAAADGTGHADAKPRVALAIVGDAPAARRALLDAALGALPVGAASPRDDRVTIVRRAAERDYEARSRDMRRVVRFSSRTPDRSGIFDKHVGNAEAALAQATAAREGAAAQLREGEAASAAIEAETKKAGQALEMAKEELERAGHAIEAAREHLARSEALVRAAPALPAVLAGEPPWWAVWLWLWRVLLGIVFREQVRLSRGRHADATRAADALSARQSEERGLEASLHSRDEELGASLERLADQRASLQALRRELENTQALDDARARVERLRRERDAYASERNAQFAADLHALDEATARGEELAELTIDYPAECLPEGLTLIDLPSPAREEVRSIAANAAQRDADAFVLVADEQQPARAATTAFADQLAASIPRLTLLPPNSDGTFDVAFFRRVAAERSLIAATSAAMRMRGCMAELGRARAAAEETHGKRLNALQGQRIPNPSEFRTAQVERMRGAIDSASAEILASTVEVVRSAIGAVRAEWTGQVTQATSRASVEAVMRTIDETAAARIAGTLERASDHVAGELQAHAETLETWALEEIHARYQVTRRFGVGELSPAASELTREDLWREALGGPVSNAMSTFEKQRVGFGLGGAAAGAVLGTLIAPGVGTAIGAFVGVFAGFLKGADALKQECLSAVEARLRAVEEHVVPQLEGKRADVARMLHSAVDEALREALDRLDMAIGRLMDVERRAIDGERAKIEELQTARDALDDHDARLAKLVEAATERLAGIGTGGNA